MKKEILDNSFEEEDTLDEYDSEDDQVYSTYALYEML